jgi:hypothetical protein
MNGMHRIADSAEGDEDSILSNSYGGRANRGKCRFLVRLGSFWFGLGQLLLLRTGKSALFSYQIGPSTPKNLALGFSAFIFEG